MFPVLPVQSVISALLAAETAMNCNLAALRLVLPQSQQACRYD